MIVSKYDINGIRNTSLVLITKVLRGTRMSYLDQLYANERLLSFHPPRRGNPSWLADSKKEMLFYKPGFSAE